MFLVFEYKIQMRNSKFKNWVYGGTCLNGYIVFK